MGTLFSALFMDSALQRSKVAASREGAGRIREGRQEPLRFILKGQPGGVGLRWTEVAVQALLLFGTLLLLIGAGYTITVTV